MLDFEFDAWPSERQVILRTFGQDPEGHTPPDYPGHEGVDIAAPLNSPIVSVAAGVVVEIRILSIRTQNTSYGNYVRVQHSAGYSTTYCHLENVSIRVGATLQAGDQLGTAGKTGAATFPHLMLILRKAGEPAPGYDDDIVDPLPYLTPLLGWERPSGPLRSAWAYLPSIVLVGDLAQVASGGTLLRERPDIHADAIGIARAGSILLVTGEFIGDFAPVLIARDDLPPLFQVLMPLFFNGDAEFVEGWVWGNSIDVEGDVGVITPTGGRLWPNPTFADAIDTIAGGSEVIVTGSAESRFIPVRVATNQFAQPIPPVVPTILGWVPTGGLIVSNQTGTVTTGGVTLFAAADNNSFRRGFVDADVVVTVRGAPQGFFTPVSVPETDVVEVEQPPPASVTHGWVPTGGVNIFGRTAVAKAGGVVMRVAPSSNANTLGFIPKDGSMSITGVEVGFFLPVSVRDDVLRPIVLPPEPPPPGPATPTPVWPTPIRPTPTSPWPTPTSPWPVTPWPATSTPSRPPTPWPTPFPSATPTPPVITPPQPPIFADALFGLHASADPGITNAEFQEFRDARTAAIKVTTLHSEAHIRRFAREHPDAEFVLRAFLEFRQFGQVRTISPQRFYNDTIEDIARSLRALRGRKVIIELHNEPNLTLEGMVFENGRNWRDGATFATWWNQVLQLYRQRFPEHRFMYPGLSPGGFIPGIRQEHTAFIEGSRWAVEAADALAVHIYWSTPFPMRQGLATLDDYIRRFPNIPIWITEASNNGSGTPFATKAQEYITFWQECKKRPTIAGVTYFVASASSAQFAPEVWVGNGIGRIVGRR
ncbi:MAG: M23 family metallopeptidase [Candidatus Promineifilaceae bacterium]